jgi:hypothetical protein
MTLIALMAFSGFASAASTTETDEITAGVKALMSTKFQVGADGTPTTGPVGMGTQAAAADVQSFSRGVGLFGGISAEGTVIHPDVDRNHREVAPSGLQSSRRKTGRLVGFVGSPMVTHPACVAPRLRSASAAPGRQA